MNGLRDIDEFVYGGVVRDMPDTAHCSDEDWSEYLFLMDNTAGLVREWWLHSPSGYWFIAERDTVSDVISATFDPSLFFTWAAAEHTQANSDD